MLRLVVFLEPFVGWLDFSGNDELVVRSGEGPEVRAENHDTEVDVHIIVVLLHSLLEGIGEVLAQ